MAARDAEVGARKRVYPRPAEIGRLINAVHASGFEPSTMEFLPDGTVRFSKVPTEVGPDSEFDRWNARGAL